jgi:hypothetical protein
MAMGCNNTHATSVRRIMRRRKCISISLSRGLSRQNGWCTVTYNATSLAEIPALFHQ